ncbi:coiled-coil domain-containing protein 183-like [Hypomesus transpacificus]|uniref:coiled-coil domain-containing protein 183-like n=1 Tax=Hypomesus transpacificus TaxID=137520 RepID=UPI001F0867FB|nr:coiled-coil domain-containing protein 183-like [Hypomesus transpacificus]
MKSTEVEQPRTLSLQEQRLRIQQLERQIQAECTAAKEILENDQKSSRDGKPFRRSLPKPGLPLESLLEKEQRRLCTLIKQFNGLKFAVKDKESQLLELEQERKALKLESTPADSEHQYEQRLRQLENSLAKMTVKITEAEKIQNTYIKLSEHLSWETREMPKILDQLQTSVVLGETELTRVARMSQVAVTAVDSTKGQLLQMERQLMVERKLMEAELTGRRLEKAREVEGRIEREKEGERRGSRGPHKLKEQGRKSGKEALTELTDSAPLRAHQSTPSPSTPQFIVKLVEDTDALREALSCTDLQELENRLVSQNATKEQLYSQMMQYEDVVKQRMDTLAALELQYAQLKFSVGPGSERHERLVEGLKAGIQQEEERCGQWEAQLSKAQAVLHAMEQGINNLYFRIICVPTDKEFSRETNLSTMEKLQEINALLPILHEEALRSAEDSSPDQEKAWHFLEQSTLQEPRNFKRASSPVYNSTSEDTFQFRSQEEDCSLSREEVKRRSIQLIESQQHKKKAQKSSKKT